MNSFIQCLKYIGAVIGLFSVIFGGFGILCATIWASLFLSPWWWTGVIFEAAVVVGLVWYFQDEDKYEPLFPYVDYTGRIKLKIKNRKGDKNEEKSN